MDRGDIVVFKRIVNGKWCGVEKQLHRVIETNLKYGDVDILVLRLTLNIMR